MAPMKKKGASGSATNYYTRSQAVRKLQISLGDFRRLCIFKGIYPREPRSKKRVSKSSTPSTTFYYAKDIQYLLHEPLLAKFRDQKSVAKKISRALGKNDVGGAVRLERNLTPRIRLDHIIKERYPTFVDALRDLDDALSMLFLFANLPSTTEVPAKVVARCQRLTMEFEHYLIRTHSLRKSFLSIKGIYYQATIQGQDVLWLVPYKFVQRTGDDVDFRIMATFVDFYTTLLGFVNFRLYTGIGLLYPPRFDDKAEEQGAGLDAFQLEGQGGDGQAQIEGQPDVETNEKAQAEADRLLALDGAGGDEIQEETQLTTNGNGEADTTEEQEPDSTGLDQFAPIDPTADTLLQPSATADATVAGQLFEPFTFFLSRETPRHPLELLLKAFGCKRVGWDSSLGDPGAYCGEDDERITHQVVDRPDLPLPPSPPLTDGEADTDMDDGEFSKPKFNERVPGRIYVQPQWVWDCVNGGMLQRPDLYAPGATLPPHLSPWVKAKKGEYDPTVPLAEQETAAEAEMNEEDGVIEEGSEGEEVDGVRGDVEAREREEELRGQEVAEEDGGMDVELAGSDDDDEASDNQDVTNGAADNDEWGGFDAGASDDDEAEQDSSARHAQDELEAEALGRAPAVPASVPKSSIKAKERSKAARDAQEDIERRKMMMPRRKRKTYEKMVYSNARKDEAAEVLRAKRRKVEGKKSGGGVKG